MSVWTRCMLGRTSLVCSLCVASRGAARVGVRLRARRFVRAVCGCLSPATGTAPAIYCTAFYLVRRSCLQKYLARPFCAYSCIFPCDNYDPSDDASSFPANLSIGPCTLSCHSSRNAPVLVPSIRGVPRRRAPPRASSTSSARRAHLVWLGPLCVQGAGGVAAPPRPELASQRLERRRRPQPRAAGPTRGPIGGVGGLKLGSDLADACSVGSHR